MTINVTSIPTSTPSSDPLFIAGTMNNWNPSAQAYQLTKNTDGLFSITFTPAIGIVKFKFTRGSWDKVEGNAQGGFVPDRTIQYTGAATTITLSIAGWEGGNNQASTASAQVSLLSDTFYMPQLDKKRRVWLYLPKDYSSSAKSYPVLYMHDGQNLFDKQTSFAGEWSIDESLDSMYNKGDYGCIVVGIDNGGGSRLDEYSPWVNTQYGGGKGEKYVDFIAQTLKPYIDQHYRTHTDAANTGIMGSSMGGLISLYAGIKYPEIFGRVGALSSAYWFSSSSYDYVAANGINENSYFYLIAGAKEGGNQVEDMEKMATTIFQSGANADQIIKESHADGQHSEWYWKREFPKIYKWLFEKKTSTINNLSSQNTLKIYQQGKLLKFEGESLNTIQNIKIFDLNGSLILETPLTTDHTINISAIPYSTGIYIIKTGNASQKIFLR